VTTRQSSPLRALGKGATATVTLCIDSSTHNLIFVKEIPRSCYGEHRFANEVSINKQVVCDQIIKILGYFTTNSSFYLIFEPGICDLFARIEADGPLSEADAKPIFRDLLNRLKNRLNFHPFVIEHRLSKF
jgi:serine/threonine protein kinase